MSNLTEFQLGQIAQTTRSTESAVHDLNRKIDHYGEKLEVVRSSLQELTTWAHRLAVLACLWGAAVGINLAPDRAAEFIGVLLKSAK